MKKRVWIFVGGGMALWLVVVLASLAAYPEWRDSAGSLLELLAKSAVGVAGFVGVLVAIAASLGYFKQESVGGKETKGPDLVKAQLILDAKLEEFDEKRQKELIAVLAILLHVSKDQIAILRVKRGSVIVEVELPGTAFNRLVSLLKSGDAALARAGVMRVIGPDGKTIASPAKAAGVFGDPPAGVELIASSGGHKTPEMLELEARQELETLERRLALARHTGSRYGEALTLKDLAVAYAARGERERAVGLLREALDIYTALESPHADEIRRQLEVWGAEP